MQILIPVDDMAYARASLHSVQQRSWPKGTKILLSRVIEDASEHGTSEVRSVSREMDRLRAGSYDSLKDVEEWIENLANILKIENCEIGTAVLMGDVTEQLANLANKNSIDYIIIGSNEKSPTKLNWMNSIASSLTTRVNCSVEIVRPRVLHNMLKKQKSSDVEFTKIDYSPKKVVLALDFSDNSIAAQKWLCNIGCSSDTEIAVIAVEPRISQDEIEAVALKLDKQSDKLQKNIDAKVADTRVLKRKPSEKILEYSKKWEADLIVLGAHGTNNSDKHPIGSTTRSVMDGSDCSVVAISANNWSEVCFDWNTVGK